METVTKADSNALLEKAKKYHASGKHNKAVSFYMKSEIKLIQDHDNADLSTISRQKIQHNKRYVLSEAYYFFLKAYISRFSPEQLLILESSNLKNHHDTVLEEVYAFLDVKNHFGDNHQKQVNVGKYSKKDQVYQDTYQKLADFYRPYNKMLEELTDMIFPWT